MNDRDSIRLHILKTKSGSLTPAELAWVERLNELLKVAI